MPQVEGYRGEWDQQEIKGSVLDLALKRIDAVTVLTGVILPPPIKGTNTTITVDEQADSTSPDELGRFTLNVKGGSGDRIRIKVYTNRRLIYDDYQVLPGPATLKVPQTPLQ